jgi:hypothetical protein
MQLRGGVEDCGLEAGESLGGKYAVRFCGDGSEGFQSCDLGVFVRELAGENLVRGSFEGFVGSSLLGGGWRDVSKFIREYLKGLDAALESDGAEALIVLSLTEGFFSGNFAFVGAGGGASF